MKKDKRKEKREERESVHFSFISCPFSSRQGQSLFEIMVGLAVGVVLIGAGTFALSAVLRSHATLQRAQSASAFTQGYLAKLTSLTNGGWNTLASLAQGSSSPYFLVASGTALVPVAGREGVLDNDVTGGLVGRWGLDEQMGPLAFDASGNGNLGTLMNGPVRQSGSSCITGGCLALNGANSYVMVQPTSTLDMTGPLTLATWVRWNSFKDHGALPKKSAGGSTATFNYGLWSYANNYIVGIIANGAVANTVGYQSAEVLTTGAWHHIVLAADGSNLRLYVDGVERNSVQETVVPAANSYPFTISEDPYALDGSIDEVRLYDRALSAAEVQRLYAASPFTRSFYLETACRATDSSGALGGVAPCAGGTAADPSAIRATVRVGWPVGATQGSAEASTYLIRTGNETFRQTDWSGGSGATTPVTIPGSQFASSSNADVTGDGSIRIHGL